MAGGCRNDNNKKPHNPTNKNSPMAASFQLSHLRQNNFSLCRTQQITAYKSAFRLINQMLGTGVVLAATGVTAPIAATTNTWEKTVWDLHIQSTN
jgi:hypothetical protein